MPSKKKKKSSLVGIKVQVCRSPPPERGCCTHCLILRTQKEKESVLREEHCPTPPQDLSCSACLPWAKEKIKTNRTLISGSRFSLLSCRQKEPSPGRLPQIKASCSPLAALPIRITTTKPAETIIYSFWCGFWSYPTSSTVPPRTLFPPLLLFLAQPLQLSLSFTPKEIRSCQLLRKGSCFEGAAVPQSAPFFFLMLHQRKCVIWEKVNGVLHSTYRLHPLPECVRL